jgi:2-phosphosulfolactate phosphatase
MRIDVALVPAEVRRWGDAVLIVLDELRASSVIVTLLERGAAAVIPAASLAEARRLARAEADGTILAGERDVVRAPGFDFGNSPAEIARSDLTGRVAVLSTRNGTGVLRSLPADSPVLVGCLLNASAVAKMALSVARAQGIGIGIVCAGRVGTFALDDAIAAGAIVERILAAAGVDDAQLATTDGHAERSAWRSRRGEAIVLTDAVRAALQLWRTTPDVAAAFETSWSGYLLASHDLPEDIPYCVRLDSSAIVPVVVPGTPMRIEPSRRR